MAQCELRLHRKMADARSPRTLHARAYERAAKEYLSASLSPSTRRRVRPCRKRDPGIMQSLRSLISMPECDLVAVTAHNRGLRIIGESPDHLHHHSTRGCGRVNRFCQTTKSRPGFLKPLHDSQHVARDRESRSRFHTTSTL